MGFQRLLVHVLVLAVVLSMSSGCLDDGGEDQLSNEAPVAILTGPTTGRVGESLTFNSSGSTDDGGAEGLSYDWEVEGGVLESQPGPVVTYSFSRAGNHTVVVTVIDGDGLEDTASLNVTIIQGLTMELVSPRVARRDRSGTCWDTNLNINEILPKGAVVPWTDVVVSITGSDGTVLDDPASLGPDTNTYADPHATEMWFLEIKPDDHANVGEGIKITGMDRAYEGARARVFVDDVVVGDIELPTDFP